MVEVGTYATRIHAEVARTALTAAGIPSLLLTDDAGGAYPFDLGRGASVVVDEADAEDATVILA